MSAGGSITLTRLDTRIQTGIARFLIGTRDFRGWAFLNVLAEFGSEDSDVRELGAAYKESRRLWYRYLLSRLDIGDPDTLALLVDGAYAAVLIHRDPAKMRPAIAAARTLLSAAGGGKLSQESRVLRGAGRGRIRFRTCASIEG